MGIRRSDARLQRGNKHNSLPRSKRNSSDLLVSLHPTLLQPDLRKQHAALVSNLRIPEQAQSFQKNICHLIRSSSCKIYQKTTTWTASLQYLAGLRGFEKYGWCLGEGGLRSLSMKPKLGRSALRKAHLAWDWERRASRSKLYINASELAWAAPFYRWRYSRRYPGTVETTDLVQAPVLLCNDLCACFDCSKTMAAC